MRRTKRLSWAKTVAQYRMLLYGLGEARFGGTTGDGLTKGKGGFGPEESRNILSSRGKWSLAQALSCRVRCMTDGVVLGSAAFIDGFFAGKREYFGPKRESGARKLRGAEWGSLRSLRDLRDDVIGSP